MDNAYGFDFSYHKPRFSIGARIIGFSITDTSGNVSDRLVSTFQATSFNAALDHRIILKRQFLLFGEFAVDRHGAIAVLESALFNLTPASKLAIAFRHYGKKFSAPLGNGFSAQSSHSGESGLYLTSSHILGRSLELNLFADYYRLTDLSYQTDAPVDCIEFGLNSNLEISHHSQLQLKYTFRSKPQNGKGNTFYREIEERRRHKIHLLWTNVPYPLLKLKTGIDWLMNADRNVSAKRHGILLYQDIALNMEQLGLSLHGRIAFFNTDSYDERLYAYEDDVYYAFTIGSYYYQGIRGYLVLHYKRKWFSCWLRLSRTYYLDKETIGSGLNEIKAPHKTELRAQVMFNF